MRMDVRGMKVECRKAKLVEAWAGKGGGGGDVEGSNEVWKCKLLDTKLQYILCIGSILHASAYIRSAAPENIII